LPHESTKHEARSAWQRMGVAPVST